jgi:F-type H+-transporting ATPase subunit b
MFAAIIHNDEFWVALAFVLILVVAWRPAQRRLGATLDERAVVIKSELDQAQQLREEAQRTLAEYQRNQRDALRQAEQIVALAREEAERAAELAKQDLAATLERRRRLAAERIALEEQKAMAEMRNLAVDVAVAAVRQILVRDLDETRRTQLVDQAIKALPRQLAL